MPSPPNPYQQAQFLTSAHTLQQCPDDRGAEVAFAGRSNAGKSSAINTLVAQKSLARTSKTPGRTQLLNFFSVDGERRLVDLPGYGYAKVPIKVKNHWVVMMEDYLRNRGSLRGLVLVMDIRHPLTDFDWQMLEWAHGAGMAVHVLLTKADKLSYGAAKATLLQVQRELRQAAMAATAQLFSAHTRLGVDEARGVMNRWFGMDVEAGDDQAVMDQSN